MNDPEAQPPVTMPECDGNDPTAYSRCNPVRLRRYKPFAPRNASGVIGDALGARELSSAQAALAWSARKEIRDYPGY